MSKTRSPVFFELAEVAEMLGRSEMRVRQLVAAGELPAAKVGGRLRIPVAAFDTWLDDINRQALASVDHAGQGDGGPGLLLEDITLDELDERLLRIGVDDLGELEAERRAEERARGEHDVDIAPHRKRER